MSSQYHFQLVFLRLALKRNILSESNLKITLLELNQEQQSASSALQIQQLKIKKNQKIIDLDSIKAFCFNATKENAENRYTIKYEIKGNSEDRVRTIPIDLLKMMQEYQNSKKTVFEESFGGQNAQLTFKFYLTHNETEHQAFNLLVTPENKEEEAESHGNGTKRSNSISRSKRPPNLNINRLGSNVSPPKSSDEVDSAQKPMMKHFASNGHPSLLTMSPISPEIGKMPLLTLNNLESHDQNNSSVSGTQKKISSLPLSQIQKVNELIATHHRPPAEHPQAHHLSYKLKIVIIMLIIGIAFLLFDTLSDRKSRKPSKSKANDAHGHDEHANEHEDHQAEEAHHKPKAKHPKKKQATSKIPKEQGKAKKKAVPVASAVPQKHK